MPGDEPDLTSYDAILVASSAGKDSQAMLDLVAERATLRGVLGRVVVVHCDLGRVEWAGTAELAERQARHYGLRFERVSRPQGDLLEHVARMGFWPRPATRYCTSDHKRAQVYRVMTRLAAEHRARGATRPCRILNCMGLRAQESAARAACVVCLGREARPPSASRRWVPVSNCAACDKTGRRAVLSRDASASNGRREVDVWYPVHAWTEEQVWDRIRRSGVPHHRAYDLGMRRLSCVFCIFAPESALLLAGQHNRALLDEYVRVEDQIGHAFRGSRTKKLHLRVIRDRLEQGERAAGAVDDGCWGM